jgi:uncharacterized membrane protein YgcG
MKRLLLTVLAALAGTCAVYAQSLRSIDIRAVLNPDGSARITQVYDATVVDGTEMYIPITNLGEMTVGDLTVRENGLAYHNEGRRWDTDRSLSEKAGRCGIIEKRNGVELCWGKTSYGDHVWTIEYTVTGLVQSFTDADGFNFMFVNPGFDAPAQHVKVTLVNGTGGPQWTYDNTRVWGFGSYGDINVMDDGTIVYESSEPFSYESKVIELVRFEKGLFQPEIERDMSFDELKENALDGSSYGEDDKAETFFKWLMAILVGGSLLASLRAAVLQALGYKYKKSMYGKTKITEWFREAPMGGNLFASSYVLDNGWRFAGPASSKNLIGALFLRWILDGKVKAMPDPDKPKRVNLAFTPGLTFDDDVEGALYNMAVEASGGNLLLESGEFEKWSEKHYKQFLAWPDRAKARGRSILHEKNLLQHGSTTNKDGQEQACRVVEFKNFLNDFTLSKERGAGEVGLWKDYLVFAQLYGIADKVAEQFQKLYPKEFEELSRSVGMDPTAMQRTIRMNNMTTTSAMNRATSKYQAGSIRGTGGHTSFGGGGGFSGGGGR